MEKMKRKKYYKVGETVWIKAQQRTGTVISIDIGSYDVVVQVSDVTVTGGGSISQITMKLWDITKYRQPVVRLGNLSTRKPLEIKVKYLTKILPGDSFRPLEQIVVGNWVDLRASQNVTMNKGDEFLIPLGVAMQLPAGWEAYVVPRSSTLNKFGLTQGNHFGVIDETYCGDGDQWYFSAIAMRDTSVKRGDRICQFRIQRSMPKINFITVETLGNNDRGGFGSTGTN